MTVPTDAADVSAPESPPGSAPGDAPASPPETDAQGAAVEGLASAFAGLSTEQLAVKVEAALLSAERPWTAGRLAEAMGLGGAQAVEAAVDHLNAEYERAGRAMRVEAVAGGLRVVTRPEHADAVRAVQKRAVESKLSVAAMEALSIVAYRQPIQRTDIEAIRGAASGEVLRALMDRRLVKVVGRAEELGRPMLYGTTQHFLEAFGLTSIRDLPKVEAMPAPSGPPAEAGVSAEAAAAADQADEGVSDAGAEAGSDAASEGDG
ncbi:MAG: SMC-Scp complex subunit ScpB [Planctomycetota bacterium]